MQLQGPANRIKRVFIPRFGKIQSTKENVAGTVSRTESYGKASYVHLKWKIRKKLSRLLWNKVELVASIREKTRSLDRAPSPPRAGCEFFPRLVVRNCTARKREIAAVVQYRRPKDI